METTPLTHTRHEDTWAYALVFPYNEATVDEANKALTPHALEILARLFAAGIETKLFVSQSLSTATKTPSMVICKLRTTNEFLLSEAARINLPMPMNAEKLRAIASAGFTGTDGRVIDSFAIAQLPSDKYTPYEHVHMKYDSAPHAQDLYQRHSAHHLFSSTKRLLLLESLIVNVAQLNLEALKAEGTILDCFPLHDETELPALRDALTSMTYWTWNTPVHAVKNYFGCKIGLYFAYLVYYSNWLLVAGIVGFLVFLVEASAKTQLLQLSANVTSTINLVQVYTVPIFGAFIVLWATLFLESWKRKSATYALEWGTTDIEQVEQLRPQYQGVEAHCSITGARIKYFSDAEKFWRQVVSWCVLVVIILIDVAIVGLVFYLRNRLMNHYPDLLTFSVGGHVVSLSSPVCSFVNVLQMNIMYRIYDRLSISMNEYENHATDTEYEAHYLVKSIIFNFVNSYAALIYVAMLKELVEGHCWEDDCFWELRYSLIIIYGVQIVVGNVKEVWVPRLYNKLLSHRTIALQEIGLKSAAEQQFLKTEYGWKGTFDDTLEMVIQFGYSSFFVIAFPLTPLLSYINNVIEIRIDGYRLTVDCRRPVPRNVDGLGLWVDVLENFVTFSIVTNAYVIFYTHGYLSDVIDVYVWQNVNRPYWDLALFVGFVTTVLLFRACLAMMINDVPVAVDKQLKRQAFLVTKVLDQVVADKDVAKTRKLVVADLKAINVIEDDDSKSVAGYGATQSVV
ncbi:anoctamin-like protein [Achlya hypogyna]|uniref:Anoctamin-like protein n=1 Tax=Achlya hypogyna TaxID=1202772 RepID=A0A1V9YI46_ACHHY|nr:anoctamin-like protein [Achlya hypogyna]